MSKRIWFLPAMQAYVTTEYSRTRGGWQQCVIELIDNGQLVMRLADEAIDRIDINAEYWRTTLLSSMAEHKEAVEAFLRAVCGYEPDWKQEGSLSVGDGLWISSYAVDDWCNFASDLEEV